jgi:hypothetical protein
LLVIFSEIEVQILLMFSNAYGLQGWLAELIGVKIDASGVSFPNRVFPQFPYLVFFRRKLSKGSFDRVNFVRKKSSLVIYSAGEEVTVPITTRFDGIAVAKRLRNEFPKVSVTHARLCHQRLCRRLTAKRRAMARRVTAGAAK